MRWDLVLERKSLHKLSVDTTRKILKRIAHSAERNRGIGFESKVGQLTEPVLITDTDGQEKYRYLVKLRLIDNRSRSTESSEAKFKHIVKVVERCASTRNWCVIQSGSNKVAAQPVGEKEESVAKLIRPEFQVPKLDEEAQAGYFGGIYERDSHIRLIHDSTNMFAATRHSLKIKRSHTLLYGKPAACKTTIFEAFKAWYESDIDQNATQPIERVAMIDATTLTKAGLERWILNRSEEGTLPEILCLEEVEKHQPDNLLSLLSVMDGRGQLQRTNCRDGHVKAAARILIWATCNNEETLKNFHRGALWSRFTHKYECLRPTRPLMHRILLREIADMKGDPAWADKALDFGFDVMKTDDPRTIIGLLDGRERLMTGEYQKDQLAANARKEEN